MQKINELYAKSREAVRLECEALRRNDWDGFKKHRAERNIIERQISEAAQFKS